jgi:DNA polymerase III gamma/tau subunit
MARTRLVKEVWESLGSLPGLLDRAERLTGDGADFEAALQTLLAFTRDAAVTRLGAPAAALLPATWRAEVERIIGDTSLAALLRVHAAQRDAQGALAWRVQPRLAAERMLLQMRDAVGGSEAQT